MFAITGEMIISGFVSKVVNDCVDILKEKIKHADKNRQPNEQNIETRIYQVTIDALNEFPHNKHKKEEKVYYAAECILNGLKDSKINKIEAVRKGLKVLAPQVTSETCEEFLEILHHEICIDKNDILYKEIILLQGEQTFEAVREGFDVSNRNDEETHRKLDYAIEGINNIDKKIDGIENAETRHYEMPVKNRAEEYAKKWDKNVFLNDFNKRDKNAGVNIKLKDIYLEKHLPHYVWKADDDPRDDLRGLLSEYIVDNDDKKMLLILGQPGIGKSTLITWIMANLVERKEDIFVYQFASDLGNVDWQRNNILDGIFKSIGCGYRELEGKILVLDGFDEIYVNDDNRERILSKMNQELERMNFLKRFSLIITCRQNYVEQSQLEGSDYITLQAWNEEQIKSFCEIYEKENARKNPEVVNKENLEMKINKILENEEAFGIPLILYMVLALNVDVEKSSSMVDIYDQIFSLKKGGIYDRCYDVEHRINSPGIRERIHQVSQRIAFWIFENNSEKASIPQKEFKNICDNVVNEAGEKNENLQSDVLIGNYFTTIKHCEGVGTDELQFVHRSIYEYFVTVYFFESIHKLASKKEVAGKLGELLKGGQLSKQMLEFIKYKFDSMEEYSLSGITKEVFNIMLRDGMTYYVNGKYKNIIVREMNIFSNMLEVVHLWNSELEKLDNNIVSYLKHIHLLKLNLRGVDLIEADLSGAYLRGADLRGVYLRGADLRAADLSRAYLRGRDLRGTYFVEADLRRADLRRADLRGAYFIEADLRGADLRGADLRGADLRGADFIEAYFTKADLRKADIRRAYLRGAYLNETDLRGAYLSEADLSGARLHEANLSGADLSGAHLHEAYLSDTVFDEEQVDKLCIKYNINDSRVYIFETKEIISYKEYCMRKQKKGI